MPQLIKKILICLIGLPFFGTAQIPDLLIYQGDTLPVYSDPLYAYFEKKGCSTIGQIDFDKENNCPMLWSEYNSTWKIENDSLFLDNIKTGCQNPVKIDLRSEFNQDKIFADWVSFEIINQHGKLLKRFRHAYDSIYEYERGFVFKKGKLVRINNYDNTKTRISAFSSDPQKRLKFFYDNINWEMVESYDLENKNVVVRFHMGEDAKPINVKILRGVNPEIDKEARRILALLPEFAVYYRRGKVTDIRWTMPIYFDKYIYEKKLKN